MTVRPAPADRPKVVRRIRWTDTLYNWTALGCGVWAATSLWITRGIVMPWWEGAAWAFGPAVAVFVFWVWWNE